MPFCVVDCNASYSLSAAELQTPSVSITEDRRKSEDDGVVRPPKERSRRASDSQDKERITKHKHKEKKKDTSSSSMAKAIMTIQNNFSTIRALLHRFNTVRLL
jgi:hypothetical protein